MIRVDLNKVEDNPFQGRIEYGSLDDLTGSVLDLRAQLPETSGLLQVPLARRVEGGGVELAVGHRRKRAFLALMHAGEEEYATLPVEIAELDDQAMADIAWAENEKRLDLSDVERALAIERARAAFGWTQTQIGERWGLTQGAVSNLLRLLKLPDKIRALIRDRAITGRHGRALLPLLNVEERVEVFLDLLEDGQPGEYRSVEQVELAVAFYVEQNSYSLDDVAWDALWEPDVENTRACAGCPARIQVNHEKRCTGYACFEEKERVYNITIAGPRRAAEVYRQYGANKWSLVEIPADNNWALCLGCRRRAQEMETREPWLESRQIYAAKICPSCAAFADLTASEPEPEPEPAEKPAPTYVVPGTRWTPPPVQEVELEDPEDEGPAVVVGPVQRPVIIRLWLGPGDDPGRAARVTVQKEGEWRVGSYYQSDGTVAEAHALLDAALAYVGRA
jgi:ParB/RepB/Spo0J family partition protein